MTNRILGRLATVVSKAKIVELQDLVDAMLLLAAWPLSRIVRLRHKNLWLISERPGEARDNGYHLFRYIREHHPDFDLMYVMDKNGVDRAKVERLGVCVYYRTFRHYVYYLAASGLAEAHMYNAAPNSRICKYLKKFGVLDAKVIYLQHGVIHNVLDFCFYESTQADVCCCTCEPECRFISEEFGYPEGHVKQTGIARFDALSTAHITKNQILVIPTWRHWLRTGDVPKAQQLETFRQSEFFKRYKSLLSNRSLLEYLKNTSTILLFYLHPMMQPYGSLFEVESPQIVICRPGTYDIQQLLLTSKAMVTDYSSVAFDFAYMKKPLCYYQFDYEEFREGQYPAGYFSYHNGFGPVFQDSDDVVEYLQYLHCHGFKMSEQYERKVDEIFDLRDKQNCNRIYHEMISITNCI